VGMWTIGVADRLRFPRFPSELGRQGNAHRGFESVSLQRRVACEPDFRGVITRCGGRCRIRSDNWNSDPHPPISAGARGLILCPAERQPKLRRFFAYLADGAAEECRRLRRGVAGFDALAQVNDIHLGPFPAGVGSFHPPGSLVALGRLKPQCNVYASAVRYLPVGAKP